jgi:hypothetical protein
MLRTIVVIGRVCRFRTILSGNGLMFFEMLQGATGLHSLIVLLNFIDGNLIWVRRRLDHVILPATRPVSLQQRFL